MKHDKCCNKTDGKKCELCAIKSIINIGIYEKGCQKVKKWLIYK